MSSHLTRRDFLKLAGVSAAGLALSACGMSPTPAPTTTPIPPTETLFPTETPTAFPTSTPQSAESSPEQAKAMDRPLEIVSSCKIEDVKLKSGAVIRGSLDVDRSAGKNDLHEVSMPQESGGNLLLDIAAWINWYHGNTSHSGDPTDQDIANFSQKLADVQSGVAPVSDVISEIWAFNANKSGNKPELTKVALFPGEAQVPEDVTKINHIQIVYGSWYKMDESLGVYVAPDDMPRFTVVHMAGFGFETIIDSDTLIFKIGTEFLATSKTLRGEIAAQTLLLKSWIENYQGRGIKFHFGDGNYYGGLDWARQVGFSVN